MKNTSRSLYNNGVVDYDEFQILCRSINEIYTNSNNNENEKKNLKNKLIIVISPIIFAAAANLLKFNKFDLEEQLSNAQLKLVLIIDKIIQKFLIDKFIPEAMIGYIYQTAKNQILDSLRKPVNKRESSGYIDDINLPDFSDDGLEETVFRKINSEKIKEIVETILRVISPKSSQILKTRYFFRPGEQMKYKDIAHLLGVSVGTVKSRHSYAVKRILRLAADNHRLYLQLRAAGIIDSLEEIETIRKRRNEKSEIEDEVKIEI